MCSWAVRRSGNLECLVTDRCVRATGIFTLLYYTYFIVVRRALEVFSCALEEGGFYTCATHGAAAVVCPPNM